MRIFGAGIATETNTFSPLPTGIDDFDLQRGEDVLAGRVRFPGLDLSATWGRQAERGGHTFIFGLMAWAQPSGLTVKAAYEQLRDELLNDLRAAMPIDIVLLNLHGAMVAHGYDDCEKDLIGRVRGIVGSGPVIGVELDLHCHLSSQKIAAADLVITYKEYPHVDVIDRGAELFELAVQARMGRIKPTLGLFDCRMIGFYPTSRQPLRDFVSEMTRAEGRPRVLSISFGHGFPFADLAHVGAKILTVTDNDPRLAAEIAREFGLKVHGLRNQIGFESISLPIDMALSRALSSPDGPVVVADQADNIGGGAPGDATYALSWLLKNGAQDVAMAIFYDPEVVRIAKKVGVGTTLPLRLGGKLCPSSGEAVDIEVTVIALRDRYMHGFPQQGTDPLLYCAGDVAALRCGSIDIVVSSQRCQCFSPDIFRDLGIDPERKKVLIPKSYQHFQGAFSPLAREIIYMAAPGAVPPDPRQIPYRRLDTSRLYPWVENPFRV